MSWRCWHYLCERKSVTVSTTRQYFFKRKDANVEANSVSAPVIYICSICEFCNAAARPAEVETAVEAGGGGGGGGELPWTLMKIWPSQLSAVSHVNASQAAAAELAFMPHHSASGKANVGRPTLRSQLATRYVLERRYR